MRAGSLRSRLTLSMVGVVAGALLLAGAGTLFVAKRSDAALARRNLAAEARSFGHVAGRIGLGAPVTGRLAAVPHSRLLALVRAAARLEDARLVAVAQDGATQPALPFAVPGGQLATVWKGRPVSGFLDVSVYAVQPVGHYRRLGAYPSLGRVRMAAVLKRSTAGPSLGVGYLLAVSGAVLLLAAAVAARLSGGIAGPLVHAESTTRRIAAGDLAARVSVRPAYPELASLTDSINVMAENLARARGLERQFLLSVSHDLRTPLTSVRGYAEAIADGTANDPSRAAEVISSEARRLERLVADLLDLARLSARRFSLHPAPLDLAQVVTDAADAFRPAMAEVGVELHLHVPEGSSMWALLDSDRMAQVLANLLENAFKFARTRADVAVAPDGGDVVVSVTDDGPGIAQEDLPHVFERLYTSSRRAARQSGTGLGLAIVSELSAAMRIGVRVVSPVNDGCGTTILLRIPRAFSGTGPVPEKPG